MKTRSVIIIVVTLIIGFALGMLTSAQLRFQKLRPVRVFFSEERFRDGLYKVIEPDDKQKASIEDILDKYAKIIGTLQGEFRRNFDASMKDFRKEIESKLTKEQIARLREMDEKREKMIREARQNMHNDTIRRFGGRPDGRRYGSPHFGDHDSTYDRKDTTR